MRLFKLRYIRVYYSLHTSTLDGRFREGRETPEAQNNEMAFRFWIFRRFNT